MSLVRVQTRWVGVAGSLYYMNLYALGPLATNNGNDLATAWRAFLVATQANYKNSISAQIQPELLEFDEQTGAVTGAGTTVQAVVNGTSVGDALPYANQALIRWTTAGIVHNRRVRGRTFLPAQMEGSSDANGVPLAAVVTGVNTAITNLLTTMTSRMRVWAQPFEGTDTNPPRLGSAHTITGGTMAPYWAILRSRRD